MANFCLVPLQVDNFTAALQGGKIDPPKLAKMTSKERNKFFTGIVGKENATGVNALFESKLLLKNQQYGMVTWAKKVAGMSAPVRRDLVNRIAKLDRVLDPKEQENFMQDLASTRLGVNISETEARTIAELSGKVEETKINMGEDFKFKSKTDRMNHGRAIVNLLNEMERMKDQTIKFKPPDLKKLQTYKQAPVKAAGLAKSLKATLDNSVIGRQGLKVLFTHPKVWGKNSKQTFVDMWKEWGGKSAMDEVRADVLSRPNALNGNYAKEHLAVGVTEEAFPSSLPGRVKGLGRIFKGSESAFTGFQYRTRADIFDKYYEIAQKSNVDHEGIGLLANALTGRGNIGSFEKGAEALNNLFFSPRFFKSNIDALTAHVFDKNMGTFARKRAVRNTMQIVSGVGAILGTADAVMPGSVEWDPRSSDFGKIKIGNTRFDVSGGMASIVTLASRIITQKKKSSTTGVVAELGNKFGETSGMDVFWDFTENKLSPAAGVLTDWMEQSTFEGNKPTLGSTIKGLTVPIPIENYADLVKDPNSANKLVALMADLLGIGATNYSAQSNWENSTSKDLTALRQKVGDDRFKEANAKYNEKVSGWLAENMKSDSYKNMPEEQKAKLLSDIRRKFKEDIMIEYGAKEKRDEATPSQTRLEQQVNDLFSPKGGVSGGGSPKSKAFSTAKDQYGWSGGELEALNSLLIGESGWNPNARNSSSNAFGLFQFMPMHWGSGKYLPSGDKADADEQIEGGLRYIKDRYNSPKQAYNFWLSQNPHWY